MPDDHAAEQLDERVPRQIREQRNRFEWAGIFDRWLWQFGQLPQDRFLARVEWVGAHARRLLALPGQLCRTPGPGPFANRANRLPGFRAALGLGLRHLYAFGHVAIVEYWRLQ